MNDLRKARATTIEVGEEAEAQRIDNFLLRALKGVPKSHVYRVLRSGEVRVNSGRVKPDYRLQPGDRVRIPPVRTAERKPAPPRPLDLPVVFEDSALLVIDKPSGLAVHGGSGVSFGVIESMRAARPQARSLGTSRRPVPSFPRRRRRNAASHMWRAGTTANCRGASQATSRDAPAQSRNGCQASFAAAPSSPWNTIAMLTALLR